MWDFIECVVGVDGIDEIVDFVICLILDFLGGCFCVEILIGLIVELVGLDCIIGFVFIEFGGKLIWVVGIVCWVGIGYSINFYEFGV